MEVAKGMELAQQTILRLEDKERFWLYDILKNADLKDYPPDVQQFARNLEIRLRS